MLKGAKTHTKFLSSFPVLLGKSENFSKKVFFNFWKIMLYITQNSLKL